MVCMKKYYFFICCFVLEQIYVFPATPQNSTNDLYAALRPFNNRYDIGYIELSSQDTVSNIYKACCEWYKENCEDSDIKVVYNKYILSEDNEQTFEDFLKEHNICDNKEPTFQLIAQIYNTSKPTTIQPENYYNTDLLTKNNDNEECELNYCCCERIIIKTKKYMHF